MIVPISSAADPRIAEYVSVQERELVRRRGVFLAEGTEVVRTLAFHGRFAVRSVLLSERRVRSMQDVIDRLADVPAYVAPQEIMDAIVGFPMHRGCLAAGDRGAPAAAGDLLRSARTVVALEDLSNHDNIGGIFRNALAFGVDAVLLDERSADPLYRKAIRVSMGATLRVPFATCPSISDLEARGFACVALTPKGEISIDRVAWPDRVVLFAGAEGQGLSAATLAACAHRARIPMAEHVDSLNVATAVGIALFALRTSCMHRGVAK
jgi:tRNA G18 (ribose-2'-O)-methylase SpoU